MPGRLVSAGRAALGGRSLTHARVLDVGRYPGSLGRHPAAFHSASPAGLNALIHAADPLAVLGALLTNLGALPADTGMMGRVHQHEVGARPINLRAGHHRPEVGRLMCSPRLQAMVHGGAEADLIATQAGVDASLSFLCCGGAFEVSPSISSGWLEASALRSGDPRGPPRNPSKRRRMVCSPCSTSSPLLGSGAAEAEAAARSCADCPCSVFSAATPQAYATALQSLAA